MKLDGTLYTMRNCPYCVMVESYLETHSIQIDKKDISEDSKYREELISIGGKSQVPCYVINNSPLYESLDIINYFEDYVYDRTN